MLATWAADCAERVLQLFEEVSPTDERPRAAINACRMWVRTGVFVMAEIRGASLAAHAAARTMPEKAQHVLPPGPRVKQSQRHTCHNMRLAPLITR
ncbi:MAG: hypothetical protein R2867_35020 [Caldilineaceae bacterium]